MRYLNLCLLVLFPIAWFAPLMRAALLPMFGMDEISVVTGLQSLWQSDIPLALAVTFLAIFVVSGVAFVPLYNTFVSDARGTRQLQEYLNPDTRNQYLDSIHYDEQRGTYTFGRNAAFSIGLTSIQRDATTALFGMGMGARSESTSLGIVGKALEQGYYGLNSGTTLLVFMQEIGLLGILLFVIISWGVAARLWPFLRVCRETDLVALCYGLMLSALLWPFWLWYHQVWVFAIFNLLYWGTLGYVFNQIRGHDWSQEVQDDIL